MKRLSLATILFVTFSSVCVAQGTGTSDREGGQGKPGPGAQAPAPVSPGQTKPCGKQTSATSDRGGGKEKTSDSSTNNPGAKVSGDC